ncbi:MAG TPA: hypothetical protein VD862_02960 [Candidatus Paceibacterota bacterium]|nr:hypothetical protein [Candidatus Paceibacterota bacterium]
MKNIDFAATLKTELLEGLRVSVAELGGPNSLKHLSPHGTTIGAFPILKGEAAIVFSDGKMSAMDQGMYLSIDKIMRVDATSVLLISGSPAIGERVRRTLRNYIGFLEDSEQERLTFRAKVNFLKDALFSGLGLAGAGLSVMPIFVAYDAEQKRIRICTLFPDSSHIDHTATAEDTGEKPVSLFGSGYTSGAGLLRKLWRPGLTEKAGLAVAREVLEETARVDNASGGKFRFKRVDAGGVRVIGEDSDAQR